MKVDSQVKSLRNYLHSNYSNYPIYLERVPQDFRRPSIFIRPGRVKDKVATSATFQSNAIMMVVYFAASYADALDFSDDLANRVLSESGYKFFDYSQTPKAETPNYIRVNSVETTFEQDEGERFNVNFILDTSIFITKKKPLPPLMVEVNVEEAST